VNGTAQRETPHVGIFWVAQTSNDEATLLAAGCPLDQAYGACLTYGPGHYETWAQWRRDRTLDPACAPSCGPMNTRTGRADAIVFDHSRDLFIHYADRKLLTPAMTARIATKFHLPAERTGSQKRLALSKHRDAEWPRDMIHAALKAGRALRAHRGQQCRTSLSISAH